MNDKKTPILDALKEYIEKNTVRFHMPGHKGNQEKGNPLADFLGETVFKADITNIPGMDDLHQPHGIIKESQELAAKIFEAKRTYFLINGSSCGLEALIMAVCNPGEKIIVPRNIHRSILSGIILSGAVPVFFMPQYNEFYGIFTHTLSQTIENALEANPDAKAVVLVNPTYNGIVSRVAEISELVHKKGIPLLVDEAHGPHFGFHESFPFSALNCGADATVHGSHKMLSAFTQASMLHVNGDLIDLYRLENSLKVLQSTSTSYLLMASLEASLVQMQEMGYKLLDDTLRLTVYLKEGLKDLGLPILNEENYLVDPFKITVSLAKLPVNGPFVEAWLRKEHNIQVELSAPTNILLLITPGNTKEDMDALLAAFKDLKTLEEGSLPDIARHHKKCSLPSYAPLAILPPRKAFFANSKIVKLSHAKNYVCAETISCYPPGIPVICPGEMFTEEVIDYLKAVKYMGVHFQGCSDADLNTVRVIV